MKNKIKNIRSNASQAERIAGIILDTFNNHYRIFLSITRAAKGRFIEADWQGENQASAERILLYQQRVAEAAERLKSECDLDILDQQLWVQVKKQYISLLYEHQQPELAETFYNTVFTWSFERRYYNNANIFVRPSTSTEYISSEKPTYYSFYPLKEGLEKSIKSLLKKFDVDLPFENCTRDVNHLIKQFESKLKPGNETSFQLQVISSLFYRNKAAYIVGRVFNGLHYSPFVIALLNNEKKQIYVDALVSDGKNITNLFSFARAYFMVDTDVPSAIVHFLRSILPRKTAAELYTAIGLQKQGKSEFYRNFLHHLNHSTDLLKISAGAKGLVMTVFTLPSYPFVFKVINDKFAPPKQITHKEVREKYQLVKMRDRVGRMADTLEFSYVSFPLSRFSEALLLELEKNISSSLKIEDSQVIIRHLYIERRLRPMNLFLDEASDKRIEKSIIEYGNAIKELAAANIFPGDLLTKNFGVTRHGRVIFYDYDEIELLEVCNFRKIPPPRFPEDEMAAEPWYSIEKMDIFPEEFLHFLFSKQKWRKIFLKYHAELLDADYWKSIQENIRAGNFPDIFPYSKKIRFCNLYNT